jgi:hypothetical protein
LVVVIYQVPAIDLVVVVIGGQEFFLYLSTSLIRAHFVTSTILFLDFLYPITIASITAIKITV